MRWDEGAQDPRGGPGQGPYGPQGPGPYGPYGPQGPYGGHDPYGTQRQRRRIGVPLAVGGGGGITLLTLALIVFLTFSGASEFEGVGTQTAPDARIDGRTSSTPAPIEDQEAFLRFVVDDIQDYWDEVFTASGMEYERTSLVLYDSRVRTGCGAADARVGPFYCPADQKIYLDLTFFRELETRYGAPGDFAQAYVIAHEFGHHVQNLLGVSSEVAQYSRQNPDRANELSVRVELQADCYAGVWGASTEEAGLLEPGDLEEGLTAAAAVGDDVLQEQAGRRVNEETFTHGSAEQRRDWFHHGFREGRPSSCDTFENEDPPRG